MMRMRAEAEVEVEVKRRTEKRNIDRKLGWLRIKNQASSDRQGFHIARHRVCQ